MLHTLAYIYIHMYVRIYIEILSLVLANQLNLNHSDYCADVIDLSSSSLSVSLFHM